MTWPRSALAYVCAVPLAFVAGLRVLYLEPRLPFDELVERLRCARRFPAFLADPALHARVVGRLLRFLPPRGMGGCTKRSLLLLHLWTGCGLEPRLHLGILPGGQGHAWVSAGVLESGATRAAAEVAVL